MIEIDGSQKSGSGTIVRDAVPFAILLRENLRIRNIRAKRDKPGLRPQHLKALQASVQLCGGGVEGAEVSSGEILFKPGKSILGGNFSWDIGTAGSTTMFTLTTIPLALFADKPLSYTISGGLFQDYAPSVYHFQHVLLPLLETKGVRMSLEIIQPGYFPQGAGKIEVEIVPLKEKLRPLNLLDQGTIIEIRGKALSSLLQARKVSERMAAECRKILQARGFRPELEILYDTSRKPAYLKTSVQAGAALAVWAKTSTSCLIGSDMAGAPRRSSEFIGKRTAENLLQDLDSGATVDRHLADQLIPFAAVAEGWSSYFIPRMTEHVETRLWLAEEMLGAKTEIKGSHIRIRGIGYQR